MGGSGTYMHAYIYVFPNSVSTLRGSYGKGWRPGFSGARFFREFSHKSSPVRCAFPLRRLAQARERGQGSFALRHFHSVNSRINVPFWDVHVHFHCAGSHKTVLARGIFIVNSRPSEMSMCILTVQALTGWAVLLLCGCPCAFRVLEYIAACMKSGMLLWGSCISILFDPLQHQQVLLWWPCDIRVLAWRSWSRSFTIPWATRGSCRDHGEILSGVLARSCAGPFGKSLWGSLRNAVRGLCMILCRSEVRSEIPCVSLHGLVQVLVASSCGDCVGIPLKRSLH